MISVPKFPRTYHLPFSPEIHADDKTHAQPEHFIGTEIVVTEKGDGGNTCLFNGGVYARSTGQQTSHPTFDWIKANHAWKTVGLTGGVRLYGENFYGIHSIEYTALADFFYLFAVLEGEQPETARWASWDDVKLYADTMAFLVVPEVHRGVFASLADLERFLANEITKPSRFGGECEGFVIRRTEQFAFEEYGRHAAKYVRHGHVQTDEHWMKRWRRAKLRHEFG